MNHDDTKIPDWPDKCPVCGASEALDILTEPPDWRVYLLCNACGGQSKPGDITQAIRRLLVARWRIALGLSVAFTTPSEGDHD